MVWIKNIFKNLFGEYSKKSEWLPFYNRQKKRVFEAFKDEEVLTPSEIAKEQNIPLSTVRKNLNIFLEKDLVYITNPERKRNRTYSLTEEGKKVMDYFK